MSDSPLRILVVNSHSQVNAGDRAITLAQLQLLEKIFPAARVTLTSRTPALDRPLLAARGVTVIAPIFTAPSGSSGTWLPWAKTLLSLLFPFQALVFLRHLRRADRVLACGGGYFYSSRRLPGFTFWQNYLHVRLASACKKDIVFFPQSYGPLAYPRSRRLLGRLLASDRVRAVLAREMTSLSVLKEILPAEAAAGKMRFCPDMAFYYAAEAEDAAPPPGLADLPRPCVALALRDWDFPGQKSKSARRRKREAYVAGVLSACRLLHLKYGASFFIFSQSQGPSRSEDDRRMSMQIHERLRAAIPPSHLRLFAPPAAAPPATIIQLLRRVDMLVTSRMHAAIFAFLAGNPAVVIGYQPKSQGILDSLGLGPCSLAIEQTGADTLPPLCESVLRERQEWRQRIVAAVAGVRGVIEGEFRTIFGAGAEG